ncbi:MAG TPA: hypothetical protein VFV38_11280 [Ktedonobacteraceae bacterium]|nr:hypothetical protein [Ktedonobacteraceae bacterium]
MPHETSYTVLLVEPDKSLRRLIALGLLHRGLRVVEVSTLTALDAHPVVDSDLLILDLDNGYREDLSLLQTVSTHPYLSTLPTVVLAWEQPADMSATLPLRECLAKPFDARALHATIENLLETSAAIAKSPTWRTATVSPAATGASSASLCPMITAAGLLLTVIGLMLQLLVAGAGVLVMLVALLWWTLGKRPEHPVLLGEIGQKYVSSLS